MSSARFRVILPCERVAEGRRTSFAALRAQRKFLQFFAKGFSDPNYLARERNPRWQAHKKWEEQLNRESMRELIGAGKFNEIVFQALAIEAQAPLLFPLERIALREAADSAEGAPIFARSLYSFLHGTGSPEARFDIWCEALDALPRAQRKVLTWPVATAFGFIAQPDQHMFLKPQITRAAAAEYEFDFDYSPHPSSQTYDRLIHFAETVRRDIRDLQPRDYIDLQCFIRVQGAVEYED